MAQPIILQTRDFRPSALETLKEVAEQGGWASVTRYNLPYVELHPAGTAERLTALEAHMQHNPPASPSPTPPDNNQQVVADLAAEARQKSGGDPKKAAVLLSQAIALLLANGGQA